MQKLFSITISILLVFILSCVSGGASSSETQELPQEQWEEQQVIPKWTGDGGSGISLAILAPQAIGLEEKQSYLPALVQGEFVSNFSGYSAISVLDRERLDDQYTELLSGYYEEDAEETLDLGHLTPTTHIMGGNITRTETGYALQIQITKTSDKMTAASYSGTFTFAELDNLTGIRRASLDLLQKIGVTLTAHAQGELSGAAADNHINANTALARGITAQRQGTEVAALSYYFMAASYDPSLREAVSRSSILNANISSGNIGDDVRNDIAWRKQWVDRLTETEQYFDSFNRTESMPYTLFYVSDDIKQGAINYQSETVALSIDTHLHGSGIWTLSIERALQTVYDGLNATGRTNDWGLANWPQQGVTNLNAFARRRGNFSVVFELLNDQNNVIGRQTLQTEGSWSLNSGRPVINVSADDKETLNFQNVNANSISDRMTIRIASVNGIDAETAARNGILQMRAISRNNFDRNNRYRFDKGELKGFTNNAARDKEITVIPATGQNTKEVKKLIVPDTIWGEPVISIGRETFRNMQLTEVTFPNSVITISDNAFRNNLLSKVIMGSSITSIGSYAFSDNEIRHLVFPNNVKHINLGVDAFQFFLNGMFIDLFRVTIGANVVVESNTRTAYRTEVIILNDLWSFYDKNNRKAGTYTYNGGGLYAIGRGFKYKP